MDLDNYCCQKKRVCFANRITTNVQTKKSEKESDERKNEEKERWYHKRPKLKKIISKKGKIKISYSFETLDVNFERHATKHKKKKGSLSCKGHWSPKFSTVLYKLGCHQHCIHVFSSFYTNNYLKDIKTNDFVLMGQLPIKSYFLTYCILQKKSKSWTYAKHCWNLETVNRRLSICTIVQQRQYNFTTTATSNPTILSTCFFR